MRILARNVGVNRVGIMLLPLRRNDGHLDLRQQPRVELTFYKCPADAQVPEAALTNIEVMRREPRREVYRQSLAPSMVHGSMVVGDGCLPYKCKRQRTCEISYSP